MEEDDNVPQTAGADVLLLAAAARVRPLVGVQPLVQLQVDELREFGRAQVARVRLLARVQAQVRLQIGRAAEALLANVALVRLLARVHQVVLLQVRQLRETLGAHVALERPLATVRPQVNLQSSIQINSFFINKCGLLHYKIPNSNELFSEIFTNLLIFLKNKIGLKLIFFYFAQFLNMIEI